MKITNFKIVIPARLGSTRLPEKILLPINGKPMVQHVYEACLKAGFHEDDVVVAIDDEKIAKALIPYGTHFVYTRDSHESGTDRIVEVAHSLGWDDSVRVINIQGDEPEVNPCAILQMVDSMLASDADIVTLMTPIVDFADITNPNVVKVVMGEDNRAIYFSRAAVPFLRENDTGPCLLRRHLGFYCYTVETLRMFSSLCKPIVERAEKLEQLRALANGMRIDAFHINTEPSHGIDTQEDYEQLLKRMENKDGE